MRGVGGDGKQPADGGDDRYGIGGGMREGMAAASRRRRSGGTSWRRVSMTSRWESGGGGTESRPGRRAPGIERRVQWGGAR
jgi:hypothetical protein